MLALIGPGGAATAMTWTSRAHGFPGLRAGPAGAAPPLRDIGQRLGLLFYLHDFGHSVPSPVNLAATLSS